MKMRDVPNKFLRFMVGDGNDIPLWLDWWHRDGILFEQNGYRVVYDTRSKLYAKLSQGVVMATCQI